MDPKNLSARGRPGVAARWRPFRLLAGAGFVFVAALAGCLPNNGPVRVSVSGMVQVNGQPLETGSINFLPDSSAGTLGPDAGAEIKNGEYSIPAEKGLVAGQYQVMIRSFQATGQKIRAGSGSADPEALVDEIAQIIPERYNTSTELKYEVHDGDNEHADFELQTP